MPVIYFRTDGNEEIATGHIMRCLSIARACAALQTECCFLVSDETSLSLLHERFAFPNEFPVRCLHSDYKNMEAELPALQSIIKEALWLFIDSYFVTPSYLSELQNCCRTAYLDDMLAFPYPVDLVVNYDIDEKEEPSCYRNISRRLIGAAYTPLREQFQNAVCQIHPEVHNILISTGGTDACNAAGQVLEHIFTLQDSGDMTPSDTVLQKCHYHVLTSRLNSHYQELKQLASQYPTIHIHENVQDMAALMQSCDVAVSAGGTTLYELCAVGVPSISFVTADNQLNAAKTFAGQGIIPYAGDIRISRDGVIGTAIAFLNENIQSYEKRQKSSLCMRAFIDGNGSARIARALTEQI